MSPNPSVTLPEDYKRARAKARRRPSWWLRRRERRIVGRRPRPSAAELVELAAIRRELTLRSVARSPWRWWSVAV